MNYIIVVFISLVSFFGMSQFGVSGGFSTHTPVGYQKTFLGGQIGGELAFDDASTYFGAIDFFGLGKSDGLLAYTAKPNTSPSSFVKEVGVTNKMRTFCITGGVRRYIGSAFDYGFGAYGGTVMHLLLNRVKGNVSSSEDLSDYEYVSGDGTPVLLRNSIVSFNLGLQGGIKYQTVAGTFFFQAQGSYSLLAFQTGAYASDKIFSSPLVFNLTLGFRKQLTY